jgi:hypothetical protein
MTRKLTALAALAAAAVTLAAVAAAGPVAAKQRVAIQTKGAIAGPFVLTPLTPGAIKRDTGTASFCCWTNRHIMRDGLAIDIGDPRWTFTGKLGTITGRNQMEFADLPDGWAVFTGTWKVIRGTGAYAGLSGGGRVAGVSLANGNTKARFEGFLSPK